jgi:DNA-binding MarR family transcriptional regulator
VVIIDPDIALADRVRLSVGRFARRLRQQSMGGLTLSQRSALATLGRLGPMNMARLADVEGISRPSASGIASRLADRGLLERRPDPEDGRGVVVGVTDEGRAVLERGRRERNALLARGLGTLSGDERRLLDEALEILDRLLVAE